VWVSEAMYDKRLPDYRKLISTNRPASSAKSKENKPKWKGIVGESYSPEEFENYCCSLQWTGWRPSFIVLHNTGNPTLASRPNGYTSEHIPNLVHYYRDQMRWSAGPHLFIDDRQIWVFTPLTLSGVHSPSWNALAFGVEMLGDYDAESFDSGRGLEVQKKAIAACATLSSVLGIDCDTMRLHREDPRTTHACPGKNVHKSDFIQSVKDLLVERNAGGDDAPENKH